MKQIRAILIIGFLLSLSSNAHALDLSRVKTWATSEILTAADLNGEFNNILNHSLTNNDIDAAAGIVGSKLNLSAPGIIGATTPAAATYTTLTINSTSIFKDKMSFTQTDNLEYIDSLADGYLDFEATTGLRWRINATEQVNLTDGLLAPTTDDDIDLGSTTKEFKDLWIDGTANIDSLVADTADINGGTLDNAQIGGTMATGELIVNDALDDADGLGSQGTSGQFLQSAGAGMNPTWATAGAKLLSATAVASNNSGNITLAANKLYLVVTELARNEAGTATIGLRFNDATGASSYNWVGSVAYMHTTPSATTVGDDADDEISLTANVAAGNTLPISGNFYIDTTIKATYGAHVWGTNLIHDGATGKLGVNNFSGHYLVNESVTSFEIYSSLAMAGDIYVYEFYLTP